MRRVDLVRLEGSGGGRGGRHAASGGGRLLRGGALRMNGSGRERRGGEGEESGGAHGRIRAKVVCVFYRSVS